MMAVTLLSNLLTESVFSWLPDWMFLEEQTQYQAYPKNALLVTFALHLVLTSVALTEAAIQSGLRRLYKDSALS